MIAHSGIRSETQSIINDRKFSRYEISEVC